MSNPVVQIIGSPIVQVVQPAGLPVGPAGGDLTGTYPAPTVAAVNGVVVSNGATNGYVLTATGAATCAWAVAGTAPVTSVFTRTGAVVATSGDYAFTQISGTAAVGQGGTGAASAQGAINTLAGAVTTAQYLRGNGTNVVMSAIQVADVPTLNQNTTGTAAGLSTTLAVGSGGTGQVTVGAAYNALSPMTTLGDLEYESGANTASRLPGNTSATNKFLTQVGNGSVSAAPGWNTITHADLPSLDNVWWPSDQNLISWTFDPASAGGNTAPGLGVIQLSAIMLRTAKTITNVLLDLAVTGTTLTSGQNFAGLYSAAGTLVGVTADQTAAWGSTGLKTMALTSQYSAAAGVYWVGFVVNAAAACQFARGSAVGGAASMLNAGLTASTARYATNGTVQTSLSSITPSANGLGGISWWAAVS